MGSVADVFRSAQEAGFVADTMSQDDDALSLGFHPPNRMFPAVWVFWVRGADGWVFDRGDFWLPGAERMGHLPLSTVERAAGAFRHAQGSDT